MSDVTLSKAVRSNLNSLQSTAKMMAETQNKLATGKKVNSALDNPTNYFTASSLNSRAGELNSLLDSMANGVKTLEAAENGLESVTKTLESMQSTLRQAQQDKSFETKSMSIDVGSSADGSEELSFSGGALGEDVTASVRLTNNKSEITSSGASTSFDFETTQATAALSFKITADDGTEKTIALSASDFSNAGDLGAVTQDEMATAINEKLAAADVAATVTVNESDEFVFTTNDAKDSSVSGLTIDDVAATDLGAGQSLGIDTSSDAVEGTATGFESKSVDEVVTAINSSATLGAAMRATNDDGELRIENQSTTKLTLTGASGGVADGGTGTTEIEGNSVRAALADQYNEMRDQLEKLANDASFNGVNLLRGDNLSITFNETGTSSIDIQAEGGNAVNAASLGISTTLEASDLDSDANIESVLAEVKGAMNKVQAQSSTFGSNLSSVENRRDFTNAMISTLKDGAAELTLADTNEEAANLLALQTRQQLASSAMSMAASADQSVLRLL